MKPYTPNILCPYLILLNKNKLHQIGICRILKEQGKNENDSICGMTRFCTNDQCLKMGEIYKTTEKQCNLKYRYERTQKSNLNNNINKNKTNKGESIL